MSGLTAAELDRIAARIDTHAAAVRARARSLGAAGEAAVWHSPAAAAAQQHMSETIARMSLAAGRLDQAARQLRAHAGTVRRVEHALDRAHAAQRLVEHTAVGVVHLVRRLG